jgi:hypothetical protein
MGWGRLVLALVLGGSACSTAGSSSYLTLRTLGETREMGAERGGGVLGARFQLQSTNEGYFGIDGLAPVDMNADGEHIVGILGDRLINLHLRVDGNAVAIQGVFGGSLGNLHTDGQVLTSWLGGCYYALQSSGPRPRMEGTRSCRRSGSIVEPVSLDVSSEFEALPAQRRAMLLALLLGG